MTFDAVATAAMVRFGSDAELDVTVNKEKKNKQTNEIIFYSNLKISIEKNKRIKTAIAFRFWVVHS